MNTQQALQLAFQHLNGGNLAAASQLFNNILQHEPQNFAALNGRGFIALQKNQLHQAQADLQASLTINPKQPFAHKMLGIVLGAMGRFDESMAAFAVALALDARDPEVYFNRANFCFQVGQVQEALADLDTAIKLKGSYLEARSNRANLLIQMGDFACAEKDLDYLVNKVTNNPDLWVALGLARHKVGKHKESMQCNERALKLVPNHPDALLNGATTLFELEEYQKAMEWIARAELSAPNKAEVWYTKGNILSAQSFFEEALIAFDRAIALNPSYVQAFNSRGLAHSRVRDLNSAVGDFDKALSLDPSFHDALYNKSYFQLEHGQFKDGWAGYEHRFFIPGFGLWNYCDYPKWDGMPVDGILLIRGEQGLGDQILFASVLIDIQKITKNIVLQIEPRLVALFRRSFQDIRVIGTDEKKPEGIVAQSTLGSLPRFCRNSIEDFKRKQKAYLVADEARVKEFHHALGASHKTHIGISWYSKTKLFTRQKSISLIDLKLLSTLPEFDLVDLQYGDTFAEKALAAQEGIVFNESVYVDRTNDIDGLAALIAACDLVVTVSNTTAHIAAALGKPVLVMLPYRIGKLWYWSDALSENASIWYPTVKTFHQISPDNWQSTIAEVVNYLRSRVHTNVAN